MPLGPSDRPELIGGHDPLIVAPRRPDAQGQDTVERFDADVAALDEVIELRRMFGLPDYLLRAGTPDLETYETFATARLGAVPGIARIDSHLTMKVVKSAEQRRERDRRRDG